MHHRISLHQIAFAGRPTPAFIAHAAAIGVGRVTLATPFLAAPGAVAEARDALRSHGIAAGALNHPLAVDLQTAGAAATRGLDRAIAMAAELGADRVYLLTGGRGRMDWADAAACFAELVTPCLAAAAASGVALLVENAGAFNADIHIAHTLADTIRLARIARMGICVDLHPCWVEADLPALFVRALPLIGLVQVSDYVLGDRTAPCRAVPGDGAIPLAGLLGDLVALGYGGGFDLELVGPRIAAEGPAAATARAARALSDLLTGLGA